MHLHLHLLIEVVQPQLTAVDHPDFCLENNGIWICLHLFAYHHFAI